MKFKSEVQLEALNNAAVDTDKFLVSDSSTVKYRTGAQVLSDIGGQPALTNPITGSGTANYLPKFTGSTALGNSLVYDNGTNVGIGTTNPTGKLNVNVENAISTVTISRGGSNLTAGTALGNIVFPADYSGTPTTYASIDAYANALSGLRGSLDFKVKSTGGSLLTGMTVYGTSTGVNVGIGTTSPGEKTTILTSNESLHDVLGIYNGVTGTSALGKGAAIRIGSGTDGNYSTKIATIYEGNNPSYLQPALAFFTMNNTYLKGSEVERMRISANGNVGIGTNSPNAKLHVSDGDIKLDDSYEILWDNNGRVTGGEDLVLAAGSADSKIILSGPNSAMYLITGNSTAIAINDAQNVGIGTTVDYSKLTVSNGASTRSGITISDTNTASLMMFAGASAPASISFDTQGLRFVGGSTVGTDNGNEFMRITTEGNVGIGTNSPNAKLHVADGDIYVDDGNILLDDGYEVQFDVSGAVRASEYLVLASGSADVKIVLDGGDNKMSFIMDNLTAAVIDDARNVGIGTTSPASSAKLTIVGNQTFGLPGSGSNTSGRFISIEGNTDSSGEGSSRIFFTEHNSTTAQMDNYGMSIGYRGGSTSITGASGNNWTGLSQIGNGEWGMWGHDGNATGSLIMSGDRAATYINFAENNLTGVGNMYVANTIYHTGDTNNYHSFGTDIQDFVTNGSSRLYINAAGNVGIGTTTPTYRLDITGNDNIFRLKDATGNTVVDINGDAGAPATLLKFGDLDGAADNIKFTIDTTQGNFLFENGNVGIGTDSPDVSLAIKTGSSAGIAKISSDANGARYSANGDVQLFTNNSAYSINFFSANKAGNLMRILDNGNVGVGTTTPSALGTNIRTLDIKGSSGGGIRSGVSGGSESAFYTIAAGGYLGTISNIPLYFQTNNSVKATILANGNFGIGTTSPENKLVVQTPFTTLASNAYIEVNCGHVATGGTDMSGATGIIFKQAGSGNVLRGAGAIISGRESNYSADSEADSNLSFYTAINNSSTERLRITSNGNVGIGTTSPGQKLHVSGNIKLDDSYSVLWGAGGTVSAGDELVLASSSSKIVLDGSDSAMYFKIGNSSVISIRDDENVGIGTTGPSEKLDVNGTIKATDYKGYLPAFQHNGFYHSQSTNEATIYWLPTSGATETTSSQYYNTWVAPYSGRVKKIMMRFVNGTTPTATSATFRKAINGTTSGTTYPATVTSPATVNMIAKRDFSDTDITFQEGDRVQLGFTTNGGTRLLYGFAFTVELEYNKD